MTMINRTREVVIACTLLAGIAAAGAASAQQIGREGWSPQARSQSLASQFQFQKKHGGGSGGGMDALTQYVTNYNSSSTSIGNYTEVIQNLGDGATGTVTQSATQDSSGTQDSVSNTHDNQTSNTNVSAAGKGKGDRNAVVTPTQPAQ
ncbi:MAG: hypothetical protein AB7O49_22010 [Sphingomonadales bacterium]